MRPFVCACARIQRNGAGSSLFWQTVARAPTMPAGCAIWRWGVTAWPVCSAPVQSLVMILPMTMLRREFCNWCRPEQALTLITYATRGRVACRFHGLARKKLRRWSPHLLRLLKTGFLRALSGARRMRAATRICLLSALSGHFRGRAFRNTAIWR